MRLAIRIAIVLAVVSVAVFIVRAPAERAAAGPMTAPTADDLFESDAIQDLWIRIDPREWQTLLEHYIDNTYYRAEVVWQGVVVRDVGVRSRGRASRNDHKPALRLDFNRYTKGQEFLGLEALALDNLWQDPSMLRERVAMRVFERMGLAAPRETHVRLYVGPRRDFYGVYATIEDVDDQFLKRYFNEDDGYLYEYDWLDEYHFEDKSDLAWYESRFSPVTHEDAPTAQHYEPLRTFVAAINRARESELETALAPFLDLKKFITYLAIENVLSENDGLLGQVAMSNFYIYRFADTDRWQLIPWDRDLGFASIEEPHPTRNMDTNVLTRKIWASPELRRVYLQTLLDVARSVDGWLEQEVNREYAQIRAAALDDPMTPYEDAMFEESVDFLKRFARQRSALVRRYVGEIAPDLLTEDSAQRIQPGAPATR